MKFMRIDKNYKYITFELLEIYKLKLIIILI